MVIDVLSKNSEKRLVCYIPVHTSVDFEGHDEAAQERQILADIDAAYRDFRRLLIAQRQFRNDFALQ